MFAFLLSSIPVLELQKFHGYLIWPRSTSHGASFPVHPKCPPLSVSNKITFSLLAISFLVSLQSKQLDHPSLGCITATHVCESFLRPACFVIRVYGGKPKGHSRDRFVEVSDRSRFPHQRRFVFSQALEQMFMRFKQLGDVICHRFRIQLPQNPFCRFSSHLFKSKATHAASGINNPRVLHPHLRCLLKYSPLTTNRRRIKVRLENRQLHLFHHSPRIPGKTRAYKLRRHQRRPLVPLALNATTRYPFITALLNMF